MDSSKQGQIKVHSGPRLDTVTGPYPSFISYHRLPILRVWGIIPIKIKLQMPIGEFRSILAKLYAQLCQDELLPTQCNSRVT